MGAKKGRRRLAQPFLSCHVRTMNEMMKKIKNNNGTSKIHNIFQ